MILPPSFQINAILESLGASQDGIWYSPDKAISLDSTAKLRECALAVNHHFTEEGDLAAHKIYQLLLLIISEISPHVADEADYWLREYCGLGLPPWVVLLGTFADGYSPETLASLAPAKLQQVITQTFTELSQQAGVDLSLTLHERLSWPNINRQKTATFYVIKGALDDWAAINKELEQGWIPDHLASVVTACAESLKERLDTHLASYSGTQPAPCWYLATHRKAKTPRLLGQHTFDKLGLRDDDTREMATVRNLVSINHPDRVFYWSVIQLLVNRY